MPPWAGAIHTSRWLSRPSGIDTLTRQPPGRGAASADHPRRLARCQVPPPAANAAPPGGVTQIENVSAPSPQRSRTRTSRPRGPARGEMEM